MAELEALTVTNDTWWGFVTAFVLINMDNFVKIRAELGCLLLLRLLGKEERKVINSLAYQ